VLVVQVSDEMKECLFVHRLRRARDVAMQLSKWGIGCPFWSEQLLEGIGEQRADVWRATRPSVVDLFAVVPKIPSVQLKLAPLKQTHNFAHLRQESWLSIRREAHDLILVTVVRKSDELRQCLIKHA
jgi:hypothetical protein